MSGLRASLLFPLRAGDSAARLESWRFAPAAPLLPALAAAGWRAWRGCGTGDVLASGFAAWLGVAGLAAGGAAGGVVANRIAGLDRRPLPLLRVASVFAAWTPVVFAAAIGVASLLGAGPAAALYGALLTLLWGVVSGMSVVGGPETGVEGGRLLVGSCCGLAGALVGLWLALALVFAELLLVAPAPVDADGFCKGDLLVIRAGEAAGPSAYVLLRAAEGAEALLARRDAGGRIRPLGIDPEGWREDAWRPAGRVFFAFGEGGGRAVQFAPPSR